MIDDEEVLKRFVYKNEELERLESYYDDFNVFSALNIEGQELRHSNFLGWLCDPTETHQVGDAFLSLLLKEINFTANDLGRTDLSVFEMDGLSFGDVEVRREWRNIDILILSKTNQHYWVIENKVYSGEHGNQLERYKATAEKEFRGLKGTFVYLSIEGAEASSEDFVPISYAVIADLISKLVARTKNKVSDEITTFIRHYQQLLQRHILEDNTLEEICRTIYRKHKRALDLIYEYRPDQVSEVKEILFDLIREQTNLTLESSNKAYIRFTPPSFDVVPAKGAGWIPSDKIFVFEFRNFANNLKLHLVIGPGDSDVREKLHEVTLANSTIFGSSRKTLPKKWSSRYTKQMLTAKDLEDVDHEDLRSKLSEKFTAFLKNDLPKIEEVIANTKFE